MLSGQQEFAMISVELPYRPPYQWESVLRFLASRALPNIENVENGVYSRCVFLNGAHGKIRVENTPKHNALTVAAASSLAPVFPDILKRLRLMFDVDCNPDAVFEKLKFLNEFRPDLCVAGTRSVGCFDAFETAVRTVLG
ncbi:MAG TPA: adenosine deaminase, partial [Alphaproteobacteria bacterium]|nr:adenosine deaminase [Alphaproteobacteria bacterium]